VKQRWFVMDELVKIGGFKRGHLSVNRTLILAVISLKGIQ